MIPAHRIEAILSEDGRLLLDDLPFRAGQLVEIIVLPAAITGVAAVSPHPLAGMVISYDDPTSPVAEQDWDVLK